MSEIRELIMVGPDRRHRALVITGLLVSLVAACGDGDSEPDAGADDGIDRRTCEHALPEIAKLPDVASIELLDVGGEALLVVVEQFHRDSGEEDYFLRWGYVEGTEVELGARIPVAGSALRAVALDDDTALLGIQSTAGLALFTVDNDGSYAGPFEPAVANDADFIILEQLLPLDDGRIAALVSQATVLEETDDIEVTVEVTWLGGADENFQVAAGPVVVADNDVAGSDEFRWFTSVLALPVEDGLRVYYSLVPIFTAAPAQLAAQLVSESEAVGVPTYPLERPVLEVATANTQDRTYLAALTVDSEEQRRLELFELDAAGEPLNGGQEIRHDDGRDPARSIHLVDDGDALLASYLAGHEDNYVFHVSRFDPSVGETTRSGVIAFSGAAFQGNLTLPTAEGDYLYAFKRTTAADDGAYHVLRGSCQIDYPPPSGGN